MKLVVDTNILFSFFNKKSKARELSLAPELELYSPCFSFDEIEEHKSEIFEKFSLSEVQFLLIKKLLKVVVKFTGEEKYSKFLSEAKRICPDPDDVDFFALALKINCPVWSEDKLLKQQSRIKVFSTKELTEFVLQR